MIRLIGYFFGIGTTLALLVAAGVAIYIGHLAKDLPDYEVLAKYEPPVTTRIHASDGALMAEYAASGASTCRSRRSRTASRRPSCRPKTRISTIIPAST